MQIFLKVSNVNVKAENFFCERVLAGKVLSALDTLQPRGDRHPPIISPLDLISRPLAFSRRAVVSAERAEEWEVAAGYQADAALWEALLGNAAFDSRRTAALYFRASVRGTFWPSAWGHTAAVTFNLRLTS